MVQDASDESVGYQPKGYSLLDEIFLICPSCNRKLISLILVQKNDDLPTVFRAKCPKCGVNSFSKKISGYKIYHKGVDPFSIDEADTYDGKCEYTLK